MSPAYIATIVVNITVTVVYGVLVVRDWRLQPIAIRKQQILNKVGILVALAFTQYFLAGYIYNLTRVTWNIPFDPSPVIFIMLAIVPSIIAITLRIIKPKTAERVKKLQDLLSSGPNSRQSAIRRDLLRKGTHIILFIIIFVIDFIGFYILEATISNDPFTLVARRFRWWGVADPQYLLFVWRWEDWVNPSLYIPASRTIVFALFYFLTLMFLTSELCRHSRSWSFPFATAVHRTLRARETHRVAAYAFFATGFLFASIFLPYFGVIGMLAGWSLGDFAASQVGMRWGRHQFRHQDKTWEGLIAGALVCFAAAWPFLGLTWAVALTGTFVGIDLFTEHPIPMSDNILVPLAGVVIFSLLMAAGIFVEPLFVTLV